MPVACEVGELPPSLRVDLDKLKSKKDLVGKDKEKRWVDMFECLFFSEGNPAVAL
jgi:hypothetical protein